MEPVGNDFLVRATIDGKWGGLVVSTGSPITTLDRKSIDRFGLKEAHWSISLTGPAGKTNGTVGVAHIKSLEIAKIVVVNDSVTVVDLAPMNRSSRIPVAGVLGITHIERFGAVIDYGQRALYLNPHGPTRESKAQLDQALTTQGYTRVPMRFNPAYNPEVKCRINRISTNLVVETAGFTTIVMKPVALRAGMKLSETGVNSIGVAHRTAPLSEGIANEFFVGNFGTRHQKLSAIDGKFGILGIDYLVNHRAVIDFGGMSLYLH